MDAVVYSFFSNFLSWTSRFLQNSLWDRITFCVVLDITFQQTGLDYKIKGGKNGSKLPNKPQVFVVRLDNRKVLNEYNREAP